MSGPGLLSAELRVDEEQVRLAEPDGRAALGVVLGLDAVAARARLRFGPGRTCEPVARLLDRVIVRAEQAGLSPARLILVAGQGRGRARTSSGSAARHTARRTGSPARRAGWR